MATWSHNITRQDNAIQGGIDVTVEFERSGTGCKRTCTFHFVNEAQITTEGPARLVKKKNRYELGWSVLNGFDLGDEGGESKEIMLVLIKAIRNNHDLTITQATSWYDTNYPDALYRGIQLLLKMRQWLTKEIGFEPTWDQFKTYVINNIFEGVD